MDAVTMLIRKRVIFLHVAKLPTHILKVPSRLEHQGSSSKQPKKSSYFATFSIVKG